jgi:hypothetical protein
MSWCTLCHADLRSEEEKQAAMPEQALLLVPAAAAAEEQGVPQAAQATDHPVVSRGRHARAAAPVADGSVPAALATAPSRPGATLDPAGVAALPDLSSDQVAAALNAETEAKLAELREAGIDVDGMLQVLAADKDRDPLTGFVQQRLGSKGSRAIAILVASATLTALGILVMFALGSIFG